MLRCLEQAHRPTSTYHINRNTNLGTTGQTLTPLVLVPDAHRLCLMNLMLHGIEDGVECGDTLSPDGASLPKADLILTNPPFGTKKGGGRYQELTAF